MAKVRGLWAGVIVVVAALPPPARAQDTRTVEGTVRSARDDAPIASVRVSVVRGSAQAESDSAGRFILRAVPVGAVALAFERLGFASDTVLLPPNQVRIAVLLREHAVAVSPLVAVAQAPARERFAQLAQNSTVSINRLDITRTPTVAEPDVARTVQLLPGTVAKNDFTVGLNVRGGENDQNLIRLDGVPVFNPFHIGGLFGTFDAGVVDGVDVLTGTFPAEFGGRLSSVMDVRLRGGSPDALHLRGAATLLASSLAIDGPIAGTGATFLVGARRTYADAFADAFAEDEVFTYHFLDGVAKVTVPTGKGGSLTATGFWGRDALVLEWVAPEPGRAGVDLEYAWGNRLGGVTWRQPLGGVLLEQQIGISEYRSRTALTSDLLELRNTVREILGRIVLRGRLGAAHDVQVGGSVEGLRMRYDDESPALGERLLNMEYRPTIWSAFVEDQWRPFRRLLIRPGVRAEVVTGGADFAALSPRAAVKLFLTDHVAVTGSAGRYTQAMHSIRDQDLPIAFYDLWIGADARTPVARSDQIVAGLEAWIAPQLALTIEGYAKSFDHLAVRNRSDDPRVRGDEFTPGEGFARGVDVLLRQHAGPVTGWIAYGFLKAEREVGGVRYPPGHDRRHTLNAVLQTSGPLRTQMTARFGYGSPLPYTGIVGEWMHRRYNAELHVFESPQEEVLSATINGERYPAYARLDLGLRWDLEGWGGGWHPYLSILNVLNRRNVFVYTFDFGSVPPTRSGYSQLPILPTVGLEFEF